MIWWEKIVKPGVKHLLIKRGKEINKEKRGILNLLLVKQAYYVRKVQSGDFERLRDLKTTQNKINIWYEEESKRIVIQSQLKEISENEKVRIFHHKIHQRKMKRSSILKLEISDRETIVGHNKTRGLRRWPTKETIVLRCIKYNPGNTYIPKFVRFH